LDWRAPSLLLTALHNAESQRHLGDRE
jgi:hypothetical protein